MNQFVPTAVAAAWIALAGFGDLNLEAPAADAAQAQATAASAAKPEAFAVPAIQFAPIPESPDESIRDPVRANVDKLFSSAFLDPSAQPKSFNMTLRMYWPTDKPPSISDGSLKPPMVTWLP